MSPRHGVHLALAGLLVTSLARGANGPAWTTGLDYSAGDYGGTQSTEIWYVPISARFEGDDWQIKLTLPYVRITAPAGGTLIGYDDHGTPIYSGGGAPVTQAGAGDLVASLTHALLSRPEALLDMNARVKLGTASVDKGLGTGETDYGLSLDAYFPRGRATPFFSVGYRWTGDPAGLELRDTWQAGLGWAYRLSDQWHLGALFDWRAAATDASAPLRDFTLYGVYKAGLGWKLQVYASRGFSDASPDHGLGLMLTRHY